MILDEAEPNKKVLVGVLLLEKEKKVVIKMLKSNNDAFAWSHKDMPRVDPFEAKHGPSIDPSFPLVKQKKRRFAPERKQIINEKIDRLLEVGAIEPCNYPQWIFKEVIVKKKSCKWKACIYFTSLNKASPKDCYPLPKRDQLVDATAVFESMSFLDAYSSYNQIQMDESDIIHTAFIIKRGLFHYRSCCLV